MSSMLLSLLLFSPILSVLILLFVPSDDEKTLRLTGVLGALLPLAAALTAFTAFDRTKAAVQLEEVYQWITYEVFQANGELNYSIQYHIGADGLSMTMILLTAFIAFLASIASFSVKSRLKSYYILFFILELGMLGVFSAQNLFLFFVFFELTLIPMFFLIGRYGYDHKEKAAWSFLIYNGIGSAILLIAFVALFMKSGSMAFDQLKALFALPAAELDEMFLTENFRTGILIAILVAFAVKLPVVPLHSWMLRVHAEAHPAIVMIHSGILLKIGAYGMIRFGLGIFPEEFKSLAGAVAVLGVVNLLYGAFLAITQTDLKKVLAFSSVSHMGIVLIGLAALNEAGIQGAVFQTVSHGLISALLFFLVGVLYSRRGSSQLQDFGGLAAHMPVAAALLLAGGLASLGLPGMSGFISEFMAFLGLFNEMPAVAAVGAIGLILTAVYVLRAVLAITFGKEQRENTAYGADMTAAERFPAYMLLAAIIAIGVFPSLLSGLLGATLESIKLGLGG